jgi:hypothetical protein
MCLDPAPVSTWQAVTDNSSVKLCVKGTPDPVISNASSDVAVRTGEQDLNKRQAMQVFRSCTMINIFSFFFWKTRRMLEPICCDDYNWKIDDYNWRTVSSNPINFVQTSFKRLLGYLAALFQLHR